MRAEVIGITGQTGAGKSTVSELIARLSYKVKVIDADSVSREALAAGSECLERLAEIFGREIINDDGSCNRKLLARKAFASREKTNLLNGAVHPWIINRVKEYILLYQSEKYDIIIFDAPQLFESGGERLCDSVIAVTAPLKTRLTRIINRDGLDEHDAMLRINAQFDESYYREKADFVIDGSMPINVIEKQTLGIIDKLMQTRGQK